MGRRKPLWLYERQFKKATDRENYYKDRKPTQSATVKSRKQTLLYYRCRILPKVMGLNEALATPILWTPNMESEQWEMEVKKMVERSRREICIS